MTYRQWHSDEAKEQIGNGQIDDKDVAGRSHGRLTCDDVNDQRIADGPEHDEDAISGDQTEKGEIVDTAIRTETFDDRQVQFAADAIIHQ